MEPKQDAKPVDDIDADLGDFEPSKPEEQPKRTCNLDDGPCESCQ
jgi:hypothetical protein